MEFLLVMNKEQKNGPLHRSIPCIMLHKNPYNLSLHALLTPNQCGA